MNLAQQALAIDNLGRARELLERHRPRPGESDLRGWEWRYLWQRCQSDAAFTLRQKPGFVESLSFSADGDWLAVRTADRGTAVWNLRTRAEISLPVEGYVDRAVFLPREPVLAFTVRGDSRLRLWNVATPQVLNEWTMPGRCGELFFSDDGATLLTLIGPSEATQCIRWRVTDGQPVRTSTAAIDLTGLISTAVTPDLRHMAVLQVTGLLTHLTLVDVETGTKRWTVPVEASHYNKCAISPGGNVVVCAGGDSKSVLCLWDGATGKKAGELQGHSASIFGFLFSPDGNLLISAGSDQTIRLWDMRTRQLQRTLRGHERPVYALALAPGNKILFSGARDGTVCGWDLATARVVPARVVLPDRVSKWRFSEDSQSVLVIGDTGDVTRRRGRDFGTTDELMTLGATRQRADGTQRRVDYTTAELAPDARRVAVPKIRGVEVWDLEQRALWRERTIAGWNAVPRMFLDRGTRLLSWAQLNGRPIAIEEWDLERDVLVRSWSLEPGVWLNNPAIGGNQSLAALSADGQRLLVCDATGKLAQMELDSGTLTPAQIEVQRASDIQFSADGRLLALASMNNYALVCDARSFRVLATLPGYASNVASVAFSPDNRRLATSGQGPEGMRLWDVENWEQLLALPVTAFLRNAAFSLDGNSLGGLGENGRLHLWRAPSWKEIEAAEVLAAPKP